MLKRTAGDEAELVHMVSTAAAIAILNFGGCLGEMLSAADDLAAMGLSATVADARFAKPLDTDLIARLGRERPCS